VGKTKVIYVAFLRDVACQKLLQSVSVSRSYSKNNTSTVFLRHGVVRNALCTQHVVCGITGSSIFQQSTRITERCRRNWLPKTCSSEVISYDIIDIISNQHTNLTCSISLFTFSDVVCKLLLQQQCYKCSRINIHILNVHVKRYR